MKNIYGIVAFVLIALFGQPALGSDLGELSYKLFGDLESELEQFEKSEHAGSADGEIRLAREWLEQGRQLLAEGSLKKAAVLAERLPSQLVLIRVLIAAGSSVKKAEQALKSNHDLQKALKRLQARIDQYLLLYKGAEATYATPKKSERDQ